MQKHFKEREQEARLRPFGKTALAWPPPLALLELVLLPSNSIMLYNALSQGQGGQAETVCKGSTGSQEGAHGSGQARELLVKGFS